VRRALARLAPRLHFEPRFNVAPVTRGVGFSLEFIHLSAAIAAAVIRARGTRVTPIALAGRHDIRRTTGTKKPARLELPGGLRRARIGIA
jgi:hypothetical protein